MHMLTTEALCYHHTNKDMQQGSSDHSLASQIPTWHRHLLAGKPGGNVTVTSTKILVWSGKGHGKNLVFDDLHMLDVATKRWETLFSMSAEEGKNLEYPMPRSVSLFSDTASPLERRKSVRNLHCLFTLHRFWR